MVEDSAPAEHPAPNDFQRAKRRKADFMSRNTHAYGYLGTPGGYIDDWRPTELPSLQLPLEKQDGMSDGSREIYLDYAGAALPTKTQLLSISDNLFASTVLANPHSTGPAASRSLIGIQTAKRCVLEHFDGIPGRFASMSTSPPMASPELCLPGYDVAFTSGTTEGLHLIAERFPWKTKCEACNRQSIFLYTQNAHTSVIGMRNVVQRSGGRAVCWTSNEVESMNSLDLDTLSSWPSHPCNLCQEIDYPNLLVVPAECNFGGYRLNVRKIANTARNAKSSWATLADVAKAASTGSISLNAMDVDFGVLSFYKIFGEPTGLGALFVKQSSLKYIRGDHGCYQGGGSLDIVLPKSELCVPRSQGLQGLAHGTTHFRGILMLIHGFEELGARGGMHRIHEHACSLARELSRRLESFRHQNGGPVVKLYGAWEDPRTRHTAGPTVAFNILRHDGSFVGYNEVSKLASLWDPPIQLRTGCFCNPGACQDALSLSDEEVLDIFHSTGHVCGDHIDIVKGRPTGAIRVSFGKDSLWEDLDTFLQFLSKTFVNDVASLENTAEVYRSVDEYSVTISELYIFPIKSCAGQRVQRWQLDMLYGKLKHDREFALVDSSGTALRLQSYPKMTTIEPVIDTLAQMMTVSAPGMKDLKISLDTCRDASTPFHQGEHTVRVCGDKCGGRLWGDFQVSQWFSSYLGVQCWLARFNGDGSLERRAGEFSRSDLDTTSYRTGFANEQPILLISQNAVAVLNDIMDRSKQRKVGSRHFRPNVVVKAPTSISAFLQHGREILHAEDEWKTLRVLRNDMLFETRGSCARCAMVDFDPYSGEKGETLRALAGYRRRNGKITFGIFIGARPGQDPMDPIIQEGDELLCN